VTLKFDCNVNKESTRG